MTPRPEQPATAAGLDLLLNAVLLGGANKSEEKRLRDAILAIEREAAAPLSVAELAAAHNKHWLEFFDGVKARCICGEWTLVPDRHTYDNGPYLRQFSEHAAAAILSEIERGRG